jgi:hypothetical protein
MEVAMKSLKVLSFIFLLLGSSQILCLPTEMEKLKDPKNRQALLGHMQSITQSLSGANVAAQEIQGQLHQQAANIADKCQRLQGWQGQILRRAVGASEEELGKFTSQCEVFQELWKQLQQYGNKRA